MSGRPISRSRSRMACASGFRAVAFCGPPSPRFTASRARRRWRASSIDDSIRRSSDLTCWNVGSLCLMAGSSVAAISAENRGDFAAVSRLCRKHGLTAPFGVRRTRFAPRSWSGNDDRLLFRTGGDRFAALPSVRSHPAATSHRLRVATLTDRHRYGSCFAVEGLACPIRLSQFGEPCPMFR